MRKRTIIELVVFFALTTMVTWGATFSFLLAPAFMESTFGRLNDKNLMFFVAVYAPGFFGITLTAIIGGRDGLRRYFGGFSLRASWVWYVAIFLVYPGLFFLWSVADTYVFRGMSHPAWVEAFRVYPYKLFLVWPPRFWFDPGPLGEEPGWRGFALPRLLTMMPALDASLLLGLLWGLWHYPAFALQMHLGKDMVEFPWFVLSLMFIATLFTFIYQRTRANFLVGGILCHLMINTVAAAGLYFTQPVMALLPAAMVFVIVALKGRNLGGFPEGSGPEDRLPVAAEKQSTSVALASA